MRIRRRPQAQALIPSPLLHHHSDPSTAPSEPPPPANKHHWLSREEEEKSKSRELHRPNLVLGDDPSRPPQGSNVEGGRSGSGSSGSNPGSGAQRRQAEAAAADGHGRLENGHGDDHEWPVIDADAKQRLANGSTPAMPTAAVQWKQGMNSDGDKRRRGPAVLLEGSRCSRVNGRGWRCSQPTLVGYSLCEHHLGKGRQPGAAAPTAVMVVASAGPSSAAPNRPAAGRAPLPWPWSPSRRCQAPPSLPTLRHI